MHAKYLSENVGKKVAYLYTTDGAGIGFAKDYMAFMKKTYNVEPVYEAQMQETDLDFRAHLLKIKSLNPDVLAIGGQLDAIARITQQSYRGRHPDEGAPRRGFRRLERAGAGACRRRRGRPDLRGRVLLQGRAPGGAGLREDGAEKYKVRCPDHDFSQAYETAQIIKLAL